MNKSDWRRRYIEQFVKRCAGGESGMTEAEARSMGENDFEACEFEDIHEHFEDDPEGSADESLSNYGD